MTAVQEPHSPTAGQNLEAALSYVRRGWVVLPLKPRDKKPETRLLPRKKWSLLLEKPPTVRQVEQWFAKEPALNVGIALGSVSGGLVCIDVDHPEEATGLPLPPTVTAHSARGFHYFYKASSPVRSRSFPWGELRAEGNYVVAVGSVHPSGFTYRWEVSPDEAEVAELPEWWTSLDEVHEVSNEATHPSPILSSWYLSSSWYPFSTRYPSHEEEEEEAEAGADESAASGTLIGRWMSREDVAFAILRNCGANVERLGQAFCCPLPGHEETSPSAALYRRYDGTIGFCDYHQKDGEKWYSLGEVYAACRTGETRKLTSAKGEMAVWFIRAVLETGLVPDEAPKILARRLPPRTPIITQEIYEGFQLLLGVRSVYNPDQAQVAPYSWRFASKWCGRGYKQTGEAIKWLLKAGYLVKVEQRGGKMKAGLLALGQPHSE